MKHSIAFIERNPIKVRDESRPLARNEAPGLQADTIHSADRPGPWQPALRGSALRALSPPGPGRTGSSGGANQDGRSRTDEEAEA